MPIKQFKTEDLRALLYDDFDPDNFDYEIIEDELTGDTRWSKLYTLVFKELSTGKFYKTGYSRGATEYQDEEPFEYQGETILCEEVEPVEKVIIVYKKVK